MKAAFILAIALVAILAVHEAEASCASRCKGHCRAKRCGYYVSVLYRGRCYCKCLRCSSEHAMTFPENEGSSPSDMMPQLNENENTEFGQDMPTGETEQGETGI
ncbi:uncharacterized protein LOC134691040 isoform X1 [Mytilus trossulus]|uniref:uncharacterized protein LOC134691040 isoform X1 n=1 Tax=Mytilus trossulus TaxID=6551 RepID=UPI003007C483